MAEYMYFSRPGSRRKRYSLAVRAVLFFGLFPLAWLAIAAIVVLGNPTGVASITPGQFLFIAAIVVGGIFVLALLSFILFEIGVLRLRELELLDGDEE